MPSHEENVMADEAGNQGERLLHAVERILASPEEIRALATNLQEKEQARLPDLPTLLRERTAQAIIRHYSLATALGGGVSGLPALIPGVGTAAALLGGGLADMTICLKYEVEMIMALASLFGHDISRPQERSYCLMLAGLSTYQELAGKNAALDVALVEGEALWRYTPRQAGKLLATVFLRLAMLLASRSLLRAVPLAGALVGFAANKLLTQRVGRRAVIELHQRERLAREEQPQGAAGSQAGAGSGGKAGAEAEGGSVVDAEVLAEAGEEGSGVRGEGGA